MRTRVTVAGLVCAVSGLAAAGVAASAPEEPGVALASAASCVATGPSYTVDGMKDSQYRLGLKGVTCAFATKWMRKLATKKIGRLPTTITGPSGWKCTGFEMVGLAPKAYQGRCRQGGKSFSWTPRGMTGSGA